MSALVIAAVVTAWFAGFGSAYSVIRQTSDEDRELGKWIGRICAGASLILTYFALRFGAHK